MDITFRNGKLQRVHVNALPSCSGSASVTACRVDGGADDELDGGEAFFAVRIVVDDQELSILLNEEQAALLVKQISESLEKEGV